MISLDDFERALAQSVFPLFPEFPTSASSLNSDLPFSASLQRLPQLKLAVAYSGGVDSQVLLHLCEQLRAKYPVLALRALHVNHGLSVNADKWTQHCRDYCDEQDIAFDTQNLRVQKQARKSLEAEARGARYQALSTMLQEGEILLLGQHQQDQVETFFLQLKRGAGPKGLASMAAFGEMPVEDSTLRFARPLLDTGKADILAYAQAHDLMWQEDESNQNTDFDRNFLRQDIIPQLQARWSGFTQTVARSARLIAEQEFMLNEVGQAYLQPCLKGDGSLCLTQLTMLSASWQKWVVRAWVKHLAVTSKNGHFIHLPSEKMLHEVFQALINAKEDAMPKVVNGDWSFRRFQGHLFLVKNTSLNGEQCYVWRGEEQLNLPDSCGVIHFKNAYESNAEISCLISDKDKVSVYFLSKGLRFKPKGSTHSKPLKQWFKQWQVPPWEREITPLLFVNDELAMVGNVLADEFASPRENANIACYWVR